MTYYCGSSFAHGSCRFAAAEQPICAASRDMHYACEYHRGLFRPNEQVSVIAHSGHGETAREG